MDYRVLNNFKWAEYLDDSVPFNSRLMSSTITSEHNPIFEMVEDFYGRLPLQRPDYTISKKKAAMENIITNLLLAADKEKVVSISRDRNRYSASTYPHYAYSNIIKMVDALKQYGFIKEACGFYDADSGNGHQINYLLSMTTISW